MEKSKCCEKCRQPVNVSADDGNEKQIKWVCFNAACPCHVQPCSLAAEEKKECPLGDSTCSPNCHLKKPKEPIPPKENWEIMFHETYERLAPQFGYETRKDTKKFDPTTPNGKLMTAVCNEVITEILKGEEARGYGNGENDTTKRLVAHITELEDKIEQILSSDALLQKEKEEAIEEEIVKREQALALEREENANELSQARSTALDECIAAVEKQKKYSDEWNGWMINKEDTLTYLHALKEKHDH